MASKKPSKTQLFAKVRALALSFPDATERPSHGAPAFFVGKKQFAVIVDNHHGDGKVAIWAAAPEGAQGMLIDSEPAHFFRPAYVGHLGWVGVEIDKAPWSSVASVLESAYQARAPKPKARRRSTGR